MSSYPQMLFHVVLEPIIVKDDIEEAIYLEKGWSRTPVVFNEIRALQAKIAFYESELVSMQQKLEQLNKRPSGRPRRTTEV